MISNHDHPRFLIKPIIRNKYLVVRLATAGVYIVVQDYRVILIPVQVINQIGFSYCKLVVWRRHRIIAAQVHASTLPDLKHFQADILHWDPRF